MSVLARDRITPVTFCGKPGYACPDMGWVLPADVVEYYSAKTNSDYGNASYRDRCNSMLLQCKYHFDLENTYVERHAFS